MEGYKKNVIELVREKPCLWDPNNPGYKNRDYRKQAWEEIDDLLKPPSLSSGVKLKAKDIWEQMTRGFNNALGRKRKRADRGLDDKEWKFEKDMMFLAPVKAQRGDGQTVAASPGYGSGEESSADTFVNVSVAPISETRGSNPQAFYPSYYTDLDDNSAAEDGRGGSRETETEPKQEHVLNENDYTACPCRQKNQSRGETIGTDFVEETVLDLIKHRKGARLRESPRLNFFRSLMETVDSFDEDQFLNLQIDVIHAVQKQKNAQSQT